MGFCQFVEYYMHSTKLQRKALFLGCQMQLAMVQVGWQDIRTTLQQYCDEGTLMSYLKQQLLHFAMKT